MKYTKESKIIEFKKQMTNSFGELMKPIGFSGSGFRYQMETDRFLFVFTLELKEYSQFDVNFGIQPKLITRMGKLKKHNFKRIDPADCELTMMLIPSLKKPFFTITGSKEENELTGREVFAMIQKQALPVINKYVSKPELFDSILPSDIGKETVIQRKLGGALPAGLPIRTAWMLALYYEKQDKKWAKEFARQGLKSNGKPAVKMTKKFKKMLDEGLVSGSIFGGDPDDESFFGMEDLKRIATAT